MAGPIPGHSFCVAYRSTGNDRSVSQSAAVHLRRDIFPISGMIYWGLGQTAISIGKRPFIAALSGAAISWPFPGRAQQPAMPMVDFLERLQV
jgi:hypothetical protein